MQHRFYLISFRLPLALLAACADVTTPSSSDDSSRPDTSSADADDGGDDRDTSTADVRDIGRDDASDDVQGDGRSDASVVQDVSDDATDALQDTGSSDSGAEDTNLPELRDDSGSDIADTDAADVLGDSVEPDAVDATDVASDATADSETGDSDAALTCESGSPPGLWYPDADGDGSGDALVEPTIACDAPAGFAANNNDCDDTDSLLPAPGTRPVPFIGALRVPPSGTAGTTTLNIPVDSAGIFASMTVAVRVLHTDTGDLTLTLISPSGTRVILARRRGFDDDFVGTVFSDSATATIGSGTNPFTGSWRPEQPLSTLVNEPVNGDWQLEVEDAFSIESGTLQAVTLNFELRCPDR